MNNNILLSRFYNDWLAMIFYQKPLLHEVSRGYVILSIKDMSFRVAIFIVLRVLLKFEYEDQVLR